ncbi:inosine-uridine nucleoside N-ribohydrolase [Candidatus Brocadia sinica JPN1]|uniref:Inosine-uridine nucleoside N-ribohydrolase n=1 Tax=Candidatus Brocadia sinica JPN1 TaxID=1197129 RepID=A0ABQ0JVH4_9BACT|nr:inosine-uridine nucleoside N-ribohydrolase [Candidatus Brocadia sinica JPN1]
MLSPEDIGYIFFLWLCVCAIDRHKVGYNYQCVLFHLPHVSLSPVMAGGLLSLQIALERDPAFAARKRRPGHHSGNDMPRILEKIPERNE